MRYKTGNIHLRYTIVMGMRRIFLGIALGFIATNTFAGCDAGIVDIPGVPQCDQVDLTSSNRLCYPMAGNISQQQFSCDPGNLTTTLNPVQCRQNCSQADTLTNVTVSFYSDCTIEETNDCGQSSRFLINPSCSLNGLQAGLIVLGCTMDSSASLDGIFCNLTDCDMNKSLLDVYEKCSMCRWLTVYADDCSSNNSGGSYNCINVVEDRQGSSKFGCRAIACSTFGTNGIMTLNTSSTSDCWQADWYERISR